MKHVVTLGLLCIIFFGITPGVNAEVQIYFDLAEWAVQVSDYDYITPDAETLNCVLTDPVYHSKILGTEITYSTECTSLSTVTVKAFTGLIYWEYAAPDYNSMLSIGGPESMDDDFTLAFDPNQNVYAVGFDVLDNNEQDGDIESMKISFADGLDTTIYAADYALDWPKGNVGRTFIGIISSIPIESIEFDEGIAVADNIGLGRIWIGKEPIEVLVDINPDTLNLASQGQWITAHLTLLPPYSVVDNPIDPNSIFITNVVDVNNNDISIDPIPIDTAFVPEIGDYDLDEIPDLTVKFDRQSVQSSLWEGDIKIQIEFDTIIQNITTHCISDDQIRVIDRGKKK